MKGILKLGIILSIYVTVACVGLAFVYSATEERIAGHAAEKLQVSLQELFPTANDFQEITGQIPSTDALHPFVSQYKVLQNGTIIGAVVEVITPGYSGPITILVGVGTDGRISRIKILANPDTPGLGANAGSSTYFVDRSRRLTFFGQFEGKSVNDNFEVRSDIAAITASTITSRAVSVAVKAAGDAAAKWLNTSGGMR